jgi:hypothetical protein
MANKTQAGKSERTFMTAALKKQPGNSEKDRNTGMAFALICLLVWFGQKSPVWIALAVVLLVVSMTVPLVLRPFARLWYGFSGLLGAVVSKILLTVIFTVVVVPIAMIRRGFGKDDLCLNQFKNSRGSVLHARNLTVTASDCENPY